MTEPRSVVLAGGGTGGHIEPALALGEALRARFPGITVTALGTVKGLEMRVVPARGFALRLIPAVPLPRRATMSLGAVPFRLAGAVRAAARVLDDVEADVVVGFGGYVALPAYLAAGTRIGGKRRPLVVHEANARPGLANRVGSRLTRQVGVADSRIDLPHATTVGIPLRPALRALDRAALAEQARAHFGLEQNRPTLLVTGGSQGAQSINRAMAAAAPALAAAGVQVLHAVGPANADDAPAAHGVGDSRPPYVALPYLERMDLAYAAADAVLCRAGMMTVAELTAVGLPACYVPLPHGNGEQRLNAEPVVSAGGGLLLADVDLTGEWISTELLSLLTDPVRLAAMAQGARAHGATDGTAGLIELIGAAMAAGDASA